MGVMGFRDGEREGRMTGHHLILGQLTDYLTGETLEDTLDERYRQGIARFLVEEKGYPPAMIRPRRELMLRAGDNRAVIKIDLTLLMDGRIAMIVQFGPGSLVTRHRPVLAISRLAAGGFVPVAVVANGRDADILDGKTGQVVGAGLAAIPSRDQLRDRVGGFEFTPLPEKRLEMESRIAYAYEVDGACPCDDAICRL